MPQDGLTPRQERFCQEYLVDLNGTQAAIRTGYAQRAAHVQASRLLSNDKIKARIREIQQSSISDVDTRRDRSIQELIKIALGQEDTEVKPVNRIRAMELLARLDGTIIDKSHIQLDPIPPHIADKSDAELAAEQAEMTKLAEEE